ncbi:hypothetical protein BN977_04448 [Mycolicibacterium cosmeticum]|uniref:Uncharacterized protein n=2 Tax=Mycolicibacterium cosmeticum TaxID=258533 RepID=W9AV06_MYCCO|nr:hypothetical protein BN977_04448 [Mycolicibacterium cosmeticum]
MASKASRLSRATAVSAASVVIFSVISTVGNSLRTTSLVLCKTWRAASFWLLAAAACIATTAASAMK